MPGPGRSSPSKQGIKRDVLIYKVAYLKDAQQKDNLFSGISTVFVGKTRSNSKGVFKIKLPPGQYSVFIQEPLGLFANHFDQEGRINYVEVKPKIFSSIIITVDYEAAY